MEVDTSEDNDPVVSEVDVFLSQSLADSLYLVQYPLRPAHLNYTSDTILSARVRPIQQRIEVDVGVRCRGANYSTSRGEHYARMVELGNRGHTDDEEHYRSGLWDKYTLTSESTPITSPRYVAAVFKDNELHLTPLAGIVQLKSSLSHLDRADAGAKKAAGAVNEGGSGGGGDSTATESEGEEARPVFVKFARRDLRAKGQEKDGASGGVGRRVNFQEFMENKKSSEAWITVNFNDIDSEEAADERRLLFAERDDQSGVFTQTMEGYINTICPKVVAQEATPPVAMPTGVLSLTELKSLPLAQGVDKLLRSVHMIQFSRLCSLLGVMGGGVLSVCEAVKNTAVLVQGCWVVSSQQLFPGDDNASKRNSRDYILWYFNQQRFLPRKEIVGVAKLSPEALRDMLQQLAVPKVAQQQGWEFKLPTDYDFPSRFPGVVQRQDDMWKQRYRELVMELGIRSPGGVAKQHSSDPSPHGQPAPPSKQISGEQLIKNAQKKAKSMFSSDTKPHTPARDSHLAPQAITMETTPASMETDILKAPIKEEEGSDQQFTDDEAGPHQDPPTPEQLGAVSEFCVEALGRRVLSLTDLRNQLLLKQTALARESPLHVLNQQGVSDHLLGEGLRHCGAVEVGQPWNKSLFSLTHGDPCREAILNLFRSERSMRKKQLLDELTRRGLTDDIKVVSSILKELCFCKGGQWRLLGTDTVGNN